MAGGKGGSTTTTVEVPQYIEDAARRNLERADVISRIGYTPYYGPDVAAFTPTQEAAFQNVASQAGAFGLTTPAGGVMAGMPTPQEFAGGIRGYSSAPMYEQSLGEFARRRPAQFNLIESLFINPVTGEFEGAPAVDATPPVVVGGGGGAGGGGTGGGGTGGGGGLGGGAGGGGGGGGGVVIPEIPYVPDIPLVEDEPVIVPIGDAGAGDIIAETDIGKLSDAMTDIGLGGIPDTAGQRYQYYNPDIDYTDAFQSDITGQYVGTLDPSAEGVAAVKAAQDQLGIGQVSDGFYTEQPIYSASDLPLGTSTQGFDYSVYAGDDDRQASNLMQNYYGSTVSTGYDVGQVDPALAAAAGYTQSVSGPSQAQIDQEAAMGLDPFGGAGAVVGAEDTFGADLYRSLTDPTYDPEGTVLSRALGGLLGDTTSSQPTKLETLGDYLQAAPSMGMTATEAAIAYEQNKPQSKGQERSERESLAARDRGEFSAAVEIAKDPEKYKQLAKKDPRQAVKDLGLPAYDKETSRSILDKLAREAELTVAVAEDLEKYKTLAKKNPKQALADLGMTGYDREHASEVLSQVIRRVEA
jgi:hypothetical protein